MSWDALALRAFIYSGVGTLAAILANQSLGGKGSLFLASVLGAAIGSLCGWMLEQWRRGPDEDLWKKKQGKI